MAQHASTPWLYVTSSGTTGRPKIIPLTHGMTIQRWKRFAAGVPTLMSDRFMAVSSLSFHFPKAQTLGALDVGACVILADGLDHNQTIDLVRRTRVTRLSCAPLHLHALCTLGEQRKEVLLPGLRALEVTTATVPDDLRRRARQHVSGNLYVIYGAIETASLTVASPEMQTPGTVGTALPGIHLQVVDDAAKLLPRGEVGLIRIRAAGTIERYHDDPEATAKAFRDGWYYPGDMGALTDDEQLLYKGRADGINVYPMEIESVLAGHQAVREAAAFPVKSDVHQDLPVAAVTLRSPVAEADLLAFCRERLGTRAPRRVVVIEEFPRNPNGKILKRELPALVMGRR
jgi:acyl-coenzyme A synthetase/AMP-(fatty) acid ligase